MDDPLVARWILGFTFVLIITLAALAASKRYMGPKP